MLFSFRRGYLDALSHGYGKYNMGGAIFWSLYVREYLYDRE
jgi:hypothetical protein